VTVNSQVLSDRLIISVSIIRSQDCYHSDSANIIIVDDGFDTVDV
jgi:hypothetical protein